MPRSGVNPRLKAGPPGCFNIVQNCAYFATHSLATRARLLVARGASLVFSDGKLVRIRVETTHAGPGGVLTIEQD